MTKKRAIIGIILLATAAFLGWRFLRPMNIFVVGPAFERPVSTAQIPEPLETLRAGECAACHREIFDEWSTTIHSQAWTDPYFQVDFVFDGSQQICKNCHIPLDRQQEHLVLGFRDREKWDPILAPNPDFDPVLQHEGVTCAACHLREGEILGPSGSDAAPHPVRKLASGNEICANCHVVGGERWDTFYRFPPCGTVAEIRTTGGADQDRETAPSTGASGEVVLPDVAALGCVECHMPLTKRPVIEGDEPRLTRRHLWRGGHDPEMVKSGLAIDLREEAASAAGRRKFALTITNVGAAHYLPTGTPDRHLTVSLRLLDGYGDVLDEETHTLKRTILWRPFIIDLWDTRLPRWQPRTYEFEFSVAGKRTPAVLEAVVRYFLVDEKRRKRIGYADREATTYEVFRQHITLTEGTIPSQRKGENPNNSLGTSYGLTPLPKKSGAGLRILQDSGRSASSRIATLVSNPVRLDGPGEGACATSIYPSGSARPVCRDPPPSSPCSRWRCCRAAC
jgi:hypothetical protein